MPEITAPTATMIPQEFYDQVQTLVNKFKSKSKRERDQYNEDDTRKDFIIPLFHHMLWKTDDKNQVAAEGVISRNFVDFSFRINGIPRFMLETKRISENLENPRWARQAIDYSYHKDVTWAVLSNFEKLKVLNAEKREFNPLAATFVDFTVDEDLDRLDELWMLSRPAFVDGILDHEAEKHHDRTLKVPITESLFGNLTTWRKNLYNNLRAYNPDRDPQDIDSAVLRILDRLIFIRTAEDRNIEGEKLRGLMRELRDDNRLNDLIPAINRRFRTLEGIYNSNLFKKHLCDILAYEPKVLADIIEQLYGTEESLIRYNFEWIGADVLGRVYELYLGYVVSKKLQGKKKRKEQGIYYTPAFVVKFILRQTLGKCLREPGYEKGENVRVLDLACGSGSFLIEAFDALDNVFASVQPARRRCT